MSSLFAWQIKQWLQSKTPIQHMVDTEADLLRPHMLLGVANDASFQGGVSGERFLHAYLNDCRSGRTNEWYTFMQVGFIANHQDWSNLFVSVLNTRSMQGSKAQKINVLGDWLALSQLQGKSLPFELLAEQRHRHPRASRLSAPVSNEPLITVSNPKEGFYKDVFDMLYKKHHPENSGWNTLLRRMNLKNMTPDLWDAYVDMYPDSVEVPLKGMTLRGYEWQGVLSQFISARHRLALNRVVVNFMQSGRAEELYKQLEDDSFIKEDGPLHNQCISEVLYETLKTHPDVRKKLVTQHLVHAVNNDPNRVKFELDYALSGQANAHASRDLVTPDSLAQLSPEARHQLMSQIGQRPEKYSSLLEALLKNASGNMTEQEMPALLKMPYAKALVVHGLLKGELTSYLTQVANSSPDIAAALLAANFEVPREFERIMLDYLTPELPLSEAFKLLSIADSLGADDSMIREMIQTALDGSSSQNSLPIDGIVEDTSTGSAFPR